jgi:lipid A disaccharide synthetase
VYSGTLFAKIVIDLFVALKEYSPVNIIRPHTVKEIMQVRLSPDEVARALQPILADGTARREMSDNLQQVALSLSSADIQGTNSPSDSSVSQRAARCVMRMMGADEGAASRVAQGAGHV